MLEQHVNPQDTMSNGTMVNTSQSGNDTGEYHGRAVVLHDPTHLIRVGRWLKGLREKKRLSQTTLAQLCQVTSAHISQIEKGSRFPADALCFQLAQHLGCDPIELSWRVRAEKSPALVRMVSAQESHPSTGSADPRLAALAQTLQDLRNTIPEERYERLLDTIFGVLSPYEIFVEAVQRRTSMTSAGEPPGERGGKRAKKKRG
jgi:transcriptional regulator with XRE-family HTH domain